MRISVFASPQLQAAVLGLKSLDRETRKQTRAHLKKMAQAAWQEEVRSRATTKLETRVLSATARAQVSDQNVTLRSAHIGRALAGGPRPTEVHHAVEFGASQFVQEVRAKSPRGTPYTYRRTKNAQFRPRRRSGYVVYQAAAEMIPRLASLWVQTVVRSFHEAVEGRGS